VQLDAAVAALGAEDVAGETLGVHPHQHIRLSRDLAVDQRDVLRAVDVVPVADDGELAEVGRNPRLGHPVDQLLGLQPVGDELGHGDEGEPQPVGHRVEIRPPGHGAVGIQDLADHPAGTRPARRPGRRWPRSAPPAAARRPAGRGAERCARAAQIGRHGGGVDGDVNGGGPVAGGDAGGDAEPRSASMLTVKAVASSSVFRSVIWGRPSWSQRSPVRARQIRPRPCRVMKLIVSGVTSSAAQTRSPSFSRSSSSATMMILPLRRSSMAWSMVPKVPGHAQRPIVK
jgi:hypothetical protein